LEERLLDGNGVRVDGKNIRRSRYECILPVVALAMIFDETL
jgi:hypothetical protein